MELSEYTRLDAVGLATLVRARHVSAAEVEDAARRAIESVDPVLGATVGEPIEPPLTAAEDGPLAGVPFAMKEVGPHLAGQTSQFGSRWTGSGITAAADTHLGARLRAAGLRVLARTRAPEFAFNVTTEPLAHGPTRNPWNLDHSVGGSSGGAAALVAARALPIAHGTDGAGSIRIPASLCGLVGLKPTRARIPVGPANWEAMHGLAHDFVLCRTVRDAAAALDALHGSGTGDKYQIPPPERAYGEELVTDPGRLRIRWSAESWSGAPVAPECLAAVVETARALDEEGQDIEEASPVLDPDVLERALLVTWATGLASRAALLERAVGTPPAASTVEACTLAMLRHGASVSAIELMDAYADCNSIGRAVGAFFETADVLLNPTVPRLPWRLGELDQDDRELDARGWVRTLFAEYSPFTGHFNITGQPALSLPLAWSDGELPIGVQLVARNGAESTLLRLAVQLEERFPWADRIPPVVAGQAVADR